jgi:hypothetical protein
VQAFDKRDVNDRNVREAGMLTAINAHAANGAAPMVIGTGTLHADELSRALKATNNFTVITIVMTDTNGAEEIPEFRRRFSSMLSDPDVLKIRPHPSVETSGFNFLEYARTQGLDLGPTVPANTAPPARLPRGGPPALTPIGPGG